MKAEENAYLSMESMNKLKELSDNINKKISN